MKTFMGGIEYNTTGDISSADFENSFGDQLEDERVEFSFGKHWGLLMFKIIGVFLILGTIFALWMGTNYLSGEISKNLFTFIALVLSVVVWNNYIFWLFRFYLSFVIITNYRVIIIKKSIFLQSEKEVLDLSQIRDIQMVKTGFFCNLFDCGNINFILSTQDKNATILRNIYQPNLVQERCNQIRHIRNIQKYNNKK